MRRFRWLPGTLLLAAGWAVFLAPSGVDLLSGRPISSGTAGLLVMMGGFTTSVLGAWILARSSAPTAPAGPDDPLALRNALRRQFLGLVLFHDGLLILLAPPGMDLVLRSGGIRTGGAATAVMSIGMLLGTLGTWFWSRHPSGVTPSSKPARARSVPRERPDDVTGAMPGSSAPGGPVPTVDPAGPTPVGLPVPAVVASESASPVPPSPEPAGATGARVPSRPAETGGTGPGTLMASPAMVDAPMAPGRPAVPPKAPGIAASRTDPVVEPMAIAAAPSLAAVIEETASITPTAQAGSLPTASEPPRPAWSPAAGPESIEAAFGTPVEPAPEPTAADLLAGLLAGTPDGSDDPAVPPAEGRNRSGSSP